MRIRVTTRAALFEERKRQHIERGYRIEDERPMPVNGLCSFIDVRETPGSDKQPALLLRPGAGNNTSLCVVAEPKSGRAKRVQLPGAFMLK